MTSTSPLSRVMRRYFPTRPTALIVRPSRRARKCFALWCRRTERPLATATARILRPTTSFARSWRSVSTSGSSGIAELWPGHHRRRLLSFLLRSALPTSAANPTDVDLRHVPAVVIRPGANDDVTWHSFPTPSRQLLEAALVIELVRLRRRLFDPVREQPQHQGPRRFPAAVEVHGPDHRLQGVGENRHLGPTSRGLLALPEQQVGSECEATGNLGKYPSVHDGCPDLGEPAFGGFGIAPIAVLGDDQPDDRVPEELQPLVGGDALLLATPASVGERLLQQRAVSEAVAQPLEERRLVQPTCSLAAT